MNSHSMTTEAARKHFSWRTGTLRKLRRIAATAVAVAGLNGALASSAQASITIGQLAPGTPEAVCVRKSATRLTAVRALRRVGLQGDGKRRDHLVEHQCGWGSRADDDVQGLQGRRGRRPRRSSAAHPLGINTFKVAIPVKVGDVIGLNNANASAQTPNACIFPAGEAQVDLVHFFEKNAADGSAVGAALADGTARRVNVSANVLQPPEINIPGRVSLGSITGGGRWCSRLTSRKSASSATTSRRASSPSTPTKRSRRSRPRGRR